MVNCPKGDRNRAAVALGRPLNGFDTIIINSISITSNNFIFSITDSGVKNNTVIEQVITFANVCYLSTYKKEIAVIYNKDVVPEYFYCT